MPTLAADTINPNRLNIVTSDESTVAVTAAVTNLYSYQTGKVWTGWNDEYSNQIRIVVDTATTNSVTAVANWISWNDEYFITSPTLASGTAASGSIRLSTSGTSGVIWAGWNENYAGPSVVIKSGLTVEPTPEQRAEWARQAEAAEIRRKEEERQQRIADMKAERLLRSCLSKQQTEDLDKKDCFYLYVGEKRYRVDRGYAGNVKLVDESDKVLVSYCIHPKERTPAADSMLMQKLLLECDEKFFLQTANPTVYDTRYQHLGRRAA